MHFRPFEIGLIGLFAVFAIGGIISISLIKTGNEAEQMVYGDHVEVWGTFDRQIVEKTFSKIGETDKAFTVVKYRQIDERTFESTLLNAIAEGKSPDLVLLPHTLLVTYRSKLTAIPSETIGSRQLRDTYIDGAEIFMRSDGTYAVPFAVDPLVLYWNRDLFSSAGLAQPPKTWELLVNESTPALTHINSEREVTQSAIALGEYQNISHAKEILAMLLFQAGTTIIEERKDEYVITLTQTMGSARPPAQAALDFYTQFISAGSDTYSWSRLRPLDRTAFTAGTLAMYLGEGSEVQEILDQNPNMNFDIAPVPQNQGATALRNYGTFYGLAIPKASKNANGALRAAFALTTSPQLHSLIRELQLTPVHRALYTATSINIYDDVLEQAALIARGWLDPAPQETESLFKTMIESAAAGTGFEKAVADTAYSLDILFR